MYHALWADWYLPAALPALEKLFLSRLPPGARVLDVCCGSGHVTKELVRRGYRLTGIDSSEALIELARRDLPGIDLRVADARDLKLDPEYDAAISTFDSLNHILTLEELQAVFAGVREALLPGGIFVFDMNLEEAYLQDLRQWNVTMEDRGVGLVRGTYDLATRTAATDLVWFRLVGDGPCWHRHSSVVKQRCYTEPEIRAALRETNFRHVHTLAAREAGMNSELGVGRIFVSADA
jgi:SAM-dependent methyltransferase